MPSLATGLHLRPRIERSSHEPGGNGANTYLDQFVPHPPHLEKPLLFRTDEQDGHFVLIAIPARRPLLHLLARVLQVQETDIHVQITCIVKAG